MSGAPIFEDDDGHPFSIGSRVTARWWQPSSDPGNPLCPKREVALDGTVVAITRGGPSGWLLSVSFGPALDLKEGGPLQFQPHSLSARD